MNPSMCTVQANINDIDESDLKSDITKFSCQLLKFKWYILIWKGGQ